MTAVSHRRGLGASTVGAVMIVVAVLMALGVPFLAELRREAAVEAMARAVAGCDTTLSVRRSGEYVVYLETRGVVPAQPGSCVPTTRRHQSSAESVGVRVVDAGGAELQLRPAAGGGYDTGDAVGVPLRTVRVDAVGELSVSVTSSRGEAVVAIGESVTEVGRDLRRGGLLAGAVGVLVGLGLVIRGVASPSRHDRTR